MATCNEYAGSAHDVGNDLGMLPDGSLDVQAVEKHMASLLWCQLKAFGVGRSTSVESQIQESVLQALASQVYLTTVHQMCRASVSGSKHSALRPFAFEHGSFEVLFWLKITFVVPAGVHSTCCK
jgi:hypothetical protein